MTSLHFSRNRPEEESIIASQRHPTGSRSAREVVREELRVASDKRSGARKVAVIVPVPYGVAMSSLGMWAIVRSVNAHPGFRAERLVLDWPHHLLDSFQSPRSADLWAFSVSWELDYPHLITLLRENGIPLRAKDRRETDPLIMAGGIAITLNPHPLKPICDVLALGDGEELMPELLDRLVEMSGACRAERLQRLSDLEGVWVTGGTETAPGRRIVAHLDRHPTGPDVLSRRAELGWTYLLEIARGCGRGCRFCGASSVTRPLRLRSLSSLQRDLPQDLPQGVGLGLIAGAAGDHPKFKEILAWGVSSGRPLCVPALRPDQVDQETADLLGQGGVRTLSLGVEAGSFALRKRTGKGMTDEEILFACEALTQANVRSLKIYMLYGLPGEEEEDLSLIGSLIGRIRKIQWALCGDKAGALTVSANPFVPKPETPWACERIPSVQELNRKRRILRMTLAGHGVALSGESPRLAHLQAAFSRGGEELSDVFIHLSEGLSTQQAFKRSGLSLERILSENRN